MYKMMPNKMAKQYCMLGAQQRDSVVKFKLPNRCYFGMKFALVKGQLKLNAVLS